jgi:hypothetical protein
VNSSDGSAARDGAQARESAAAMPAESESLGDKMECLLEQKSEFRRRLGLNGAATVRKLDGTAEWSALYC